MGPIACLTGLRNGEIRTDPNLIALLDGLAAEGVALARAHDSTHGKDRYPSHGPSCWSQAVDGSGPRARPPGGV
ncbi:MAG: hypothetical protein ACKVP7_09875 [Hyphomicrobiaceae bacterium]